MEISTAIVTNHKLLAEALEKQVPVIRKLVEKIVERVRSGGRIFCLMGTSGVPAAYSAPEGFFVPLDGEGCLDYFTAAWKQIYSLGGSEKDVVLAVEHSNAGPFLTGGVRDTRRKGLLTACICCGSSAAVASAAEIVVSMDIDPVEEKTQIVVERAKQMALDMILTMVMATFDASRRAAPARQQNGSDMFSRAVKAIMNEIPELDEAAAEKLLKRFGSVKKAIASYGRS